MWTRVIEDAYSRIRFENGAIDGDSPVSEMRRYEVGIQSTTGHEESGGKQGGPPPKAKYYLVTDSV